jgi:hypothetical protein
MGSFRMYKRRLLGTLVTKNKAFGTRKKALGQQKRSWVKTRHAQKKTRLHPNHHL